MPDIYLQLLMNRKTNIGANIAPELNKLKKNKFNLAQEQMFDDYIDSSSLLDFPTQNQLIPKSVRLAKIKEDLKTNAQCLNFDIKLNIAFKLLINRSECQDYMSVQEYEDMAAQILKISYHLKQLDFNQPLEKNLCFFLHISASTMHAIYKVGIARYNEQQYESSLSIFALLSSLDHESSEFGFRLGIVAAQMGKLDLALQAFAYALYLDAELLGARVFSAECYLKQDQIADAHAELEEAKKIIEKTPPKQIWLDLISNMNEELNIVRN